MHIENSPERRGEIGCSIVEKYQELTILQWTQFLSHYSEREARRDQVLQESSALIHNVFGTFHCLINFSYQFGGFRAKFLGTGDGDGASPQQENPRTSQVVVRQTSTVAIGVQPMIKVDLIQVRGDDFFSQLVSFGANERNVPSGESGNQGLRDAIGIT